MIFENIVCNIHSNEHKDILDRRKEHDKNNIITLSANCFNNGSILLTLYTSEPFTGLIYSRSAPSICRTSGDGISKRTELFFNDPNECGVQIKPTKDINSKVILKINHLGYSQCYFFYIYKYRGSVSSKK